MHCIHSYLGEEERHLFGQWLVIGFIQIFHFLPWSFFAGAGAGYIAVQSVPTLSAVRWRVSHLSHWLSEQFQRVCWPSNNVTSNTVQHGWFCSELLPLLHSLKERLWIESDLDQAKEEVLQNSQTERVFFFTTFFLEYIFENILLFCAWNSKCSFILFLSHSANWWTDYVVRRE